MVVSAGPAGSITVAVTNGVLSLVSWDIVGFEVEEFEERADRIEIEMESDGMEIEVRVRLKDSGELEVRVEVE